MASAVPFFFCNEGRIVRVTFAEASSFAVLAAFAFRLRRDAAAHKRLIIIATACITRAAFNRWHAPILFHHLYAAYAATYVFLLLLAAYDLWSSRRIHRATLWGCTFLIFMGQMTRVIGPNCVMAWIRSLDSELGHLSRSLPKTKRNPASNPEDSQTGIPKEI